MAQTEAIDTISPSYEGTATNARWMQLLLGFIVMMMISSLQYVWTLFVPSFQKGDGINSFPSSVDHHDSDCVAVPCSPG